MPLKYARLRINDARACSTRKRWALLSSSGDKTACSRSTCATGRSRGPLQTSARGVSLVRQSIVPTEYKPCRARKTCGELLPELPLNMRSQPITFTTKFQHLMTPAPFCPVLHDVVHDVVLHEVFERQARALPNATAVVFGRSELTYGELEGRANQLARHLLKCGVRRGSNVAMLLPRSVDAYAALLAILK